MNLIKLENNKFKKIISDNIKFIERQCFVIIRKGLINKSDMGNLSDLEVENRSVELFNSVIDVLRKDDFKILKSFGGRSKITTYLSTIISRLFVDTVRKKYGRKREKERAKEFGDFGLDIYNKIIVEGLNIDEFVKQNEYVKSGNIDIDGVQNIANRIRGVKRYDKRDIENFPGTPVKKGIETEEKDIIVADKDNLPEMIMMDKETLQKFKNYAEIILKKLSEEEKFLLKLKFYNENEEKGKITRDIASLLNIEKRKVYKLTDKILKKCKKILESEGMNADDLF
jgi:RNA polymerase sigma factor (sigma-70 family)